jgi:DNA repair protein RadC
MKETIKKLSLILKGVIMEICVRELVIDYIDINKGVKPINSPSNIAELFRSLVKTLAIESMAVFCLNGVNQVVSASIVGQGTVDRSLAHPRDIFRHAIAINSATIIIAHNHPSDVLQPSHADLEVTRRIIEGGRLLGVELLDHVIVGRESYNSLRESTSCFN